MRVGQGAARGRPPCSASLLAPNRPLLWAIRRCRRRREPPGRSSCSPRFWAGRAGAVRRFGDERMLACRANAGFRRRGSRLPRGHRELSCGGSRRRRGRRARRARALVSAAYDVPDEVSRASRRLIACVPPGCARACRVDALCAMGGRPADAYVNRRCRPRWRGRRGSSRAPPEGRSSTRGETSRRPSPSAAPALAHVRQPWRSEKWKR